MTEQDTKAAAEPPLDCRVMPLRWGQIMLVYLEFDRNADKTWTDTEYLLKFGEAVSEATVGVIRRDMGHNAIELTGSPLAASPATGGSDVE